MASVATLLPKKPFYDQRCQRSRNLLGEVQGGSDTLQATGSHVLFRSSLTRVTAASVSTTGHCGVPLKLYLQATQQGHLLAPELVPPLSRMQYSSRTFFCPSLLQDTVCDPGLEVSNQPCWEESHQRLNECLSNIWVPWSLDGTLHHDAMWSQALASLGRGEFTGPRELAEDEKTYRKHTVCSLVLGDLLLSQQ